MKGNGEKTRQMGKGSTCSWTGRPMRASGVRIFNRDLAPKFGLMGALSLGITRTGGSTGMEFMSGRMGRSMRASGCTIRSKAKSKLFIVHY